MKSAGLALFAASVVLASASSDEARVVELREELVAYEREVRALEREPALARAEALLASDDLSDRTRADVHYGRGLLLALAPEPAEDGTLAPDAPRAARPDFGSASAFAGPGDLRGDALYNVGWAELDAAEAWYRTIPEVQQAAGATPPPAPAGPTAGEDEEDAPDPLVEARDRYESARDDLVARLRLDWRDEDVRANLEWIQRRLAELRAIEEARQEQEDPEQEDPEQEGEDGDEGEESDEESQDDESQQEPQEDQEGDQQDESEDGEREDQQDQEDPAEDQEGEPQEPEGEEERPEPPPLPEEEPEPSSTGEEEPAERLLTREEVMRLLDRLQEIEEEGERVRALLREGRRVPVERDW